MAVSYGLPEIILQRGVVDRHHASAQHSQPATGGDHTCAFKKKVPISQRMTLRFLTETVVAMKRRSAMVHSTEATSFEEIKGLTQLEPQEDTADLSDTSSDSAKTADSNSEGEGPVGQEGAHSDTSED